VPTSVTMILAITKIAKVAWEFVGGRPGRVSGAVWVDESASAIRRQGVAEASDVVGNQEGRSLLRQNLEMAVRVGRGRRATGLVPVRNVMVEIFSKAISPSTTRSGVVENAMLDGDALDVGLAEVQRSDAIPADELVPQKLHQR